VGRAMLSLVTAPSGAIVSTADMKAHLRVIGSDDDDYIGALTLAASEYLDAANGVTGRALLSQTWRQTYAKTPDGDLFLTVPPVASVTAIKYYDINGDEQTFASGSYRLNKAGDTAFVELVSGASWPSVATRSDAFWIDYVTGYGVAADVPAPIVHACRMLVAHWYEDRESVVVGVSAMSVPLGFSTLLTAGRTARSMF
jgi:uncharacterized phiE125 gp8 family phage protein